MNKTLFKVVNQNMKSSMLQIDNKYSLQYEVGRITKATFGTLGIFCFEYLYQANYFLTYMLSGDGHILTVKSIGLCKIPEHIVSVNADIEKHLDDYYNNCNLSYIIYSVLNGTICCQAVKVLEKLI